MGNQGARKGSQPPSGRGRLSAVLTAILLLGLFQVSVIFGRTAGYLFRGVSLLLIAPLIALILRRWWQGRDSVRGAVLGLAGSFLLGFENLVSNRILIDGPYGSFPFVEYSGGGEYFFGYYIPFQPELVITEPFGHNVIGLNLVIFGIGCIFLGGWLWLGDLPEDVLNRFKSVKGDVGEA